MDYEYRKEVRDKTCKGLANVEESFLRVNDGDWNGFISWLKDRYVLHEELFAELRHRLEILRDHILNWEETDNRVFTVDDARLLQVCRLCKKDSTPLPDNPLILDYGKEYAHQKCLDVHEEQEEQQRKLEEIFKKWWNQLQPSVGN